MNSLVSRRYDAILIYMYFDDDLPNTWTIKFTSIICSVHFTKNTNASMHNTDHDPKNDQRTTQVRHDYIKLTSVANLPAQTSSKGLLFKIRRVLNGWSFANEHTEWHNILWTDECKGLQTVCQMTLKQEWIQTTLHSKDSEAWWWKHHTDQTTYAIVFGRSFAAPSYTRTVYSYTFLSEPGLTSHPLSFRKMPWLKNCILWKSHPILGLKVYT